MWNLVATGYGWRHRLIWYSCPLGTPSVNKVPLGMYMTGWTSLLFPRPYCHVPFSCLESSSFDGYGRKRTMSGVTLGHPLLTSLCLLFIPPSSELNLLRSHLFLPCEFSVMLRSIPASCVAACAVTNKIVRNLPFSSGQVDKQKEYCALFSGSVPHCPHPSFVLHVKIKFHF